ncbi:head-tail adaptor protein [Pantoea ananatis]|uniref:phage head closure protein n=1 Tax=Pantoea ananas TaxID=553 RepID=UPI0023503E76|nr:phage head closure protein [Pantoea ananatis]MDC7871359.1 head-tail adaptor protein [Pantoea ananatis]
MTAMAAGELDKRIRVQRTESERGPLGEILPGQIVISSPFIWAKAENISNRKIRSLDQQQIVETWQFTIRPRIDVQTDWKISWGNEVYTIRAVDRSRRDRAVITAERDVRHD